MRKIFTLLAIVISLLSCEKAEDYYKAEITLYSESGVPVQNATVRLTIPNREDNTLVYTVITGVEGKAFFEVPNKAYYDVKCWKYPFRGCSYVEFKKNETVKMDVVLLDWSNPYNGCTD